MQSCRIRQSRRGAALYIAVLFTALAVTVLGLTGLTMLRIERRQMTASIERATARMYANSAVELALQVIGGNSGWRAAHTNGAETTPQPLATNTAGMLSWILEDTDGSLTDADTHLRLKGLGRIGDTVQVSSIKLLSALTESAEQMWLSEIGTDGAGITLDAGLGIGVTFAPTIPVGATSWSITRVDIWANGFKPGSFDAKVSTQDTFGDPETVVDSVNVLDSDLSNNFAWNTIEFNSAGGLSPSEGACITFVHASGGKCLRIKFEEFPNTSPVKRLMTTDGGITWSQDQYDLWIRIYGTYATATGVEAQSGSWVWDAAH